MQVGYRCSLATSKARKRCFSSLSLSDSQVSNNINRHVRARTSRTISLNNDLRSLRGDSYHATSIKGPESTSHIRREVGDARSVPQLLSLLDDYRSESDATVYGKAIQRCVHLRSSKTAIDVFQQMYTHNIPRRTVIYTIFFHTLSRFGEYPMKIIEKYWNLLISKDELIPDNRLLSAAISTCKHTGDVELATKIWKQCVSKPFNVRPHVFCYSSMISVCSKAQNLDLALFYFKQCVYECGIDQISTALCGALMGTFASCGKWRDCVELVRWMKLNGIEVDIVIIAQLMRVFLKNKLPEKALEIHRNIIENSDFSFIEKLCEKSEETRFDMPNIISSPNGSSERLKLTPNVLSMNLLAAAYYQILERGQSLPEKEKKKIFKVLLRELPKMREKYGYPSMDEELASTLWKSQLALYPSRDLWHKCIPLFRYLLDGGHIGYFCARRDPRNGQRTIDCHGMDIMQTRFILSYIFSYERKWLCDFGENMCGIFIACGKGSHRDGGEKGKSILMKTIIEELGTWDPPIEATVDDANKGTLILNFNSAVKFCSKKEAQFSL